MMDLPLFLRKAAKRQASPKLINRAKPYQPLLAQWLIAMALDLEWYRMPRKNRLPEIFQDDAFMITTGVDFPGEIDEDGDYTGRTKKTETALARLLSRRLAVVSKEPLAENLPLFGNIELIGKLFNLSTTEKVVLLFAAILSEFPTFFEAISNRNECVTNWKLAKILSRITDQPEHEIRAAIHDESVLISSGIIEIEPGLRDMDRKMLLGNGFMGLLLESNQDEDTLANIFLKKASDPSLTPDAFPHLVSDIETLKIYLGSSLLHREAGINILFYGPPGTGKTELAKALAKELGSTLFEVPSADRTGDPIRGISRLRSYNFLQKMLTRKDNVLLIFDEIEDVFESRFRRHPLFEEETDNDKWNGKAWINRTLERNATPAIWITNDPNIDPAYLRRFDYSVRFPIPPQRVRLDIARHHLHTISTDETWLARIANNEHTVPAQIERAAKVARIVGGEDETSARQLVEQTLDRSATLLDQKRIPPRNTCHTGYDLDFINTDSNVDRIIANLKQRPRGSFCFYGPAGTGKSELARHIADEIGKPVLLRRASDLLSMWVGEAEKNIAEMFAEARQQEAVLVLDEADSFLADRRDAQRSWEVTQVNELLTQMEACDGIFICTTNLMKKLDQASLRRFAFKLKFDYLNEDQRWTMFHQELTRLGGNPDDANAWESAVRRLTNLTPGDFAVVARQCDLWGTVITAAELYEQLRRECIAKETPPSSIGFV